MTTRQEPGQVADLIPEAAKRDCGHYILKKEFPKTLVFLDRTIHPLRCIAIRFENALHYSSHSASIPRIAAVHQITRLSYGEMGEVFLDSLATIVDDGTQ